MANVTCKVCGENMDVEGSDDALVVEPCKKGCRRKFGTAQGQPAADVKKECRFCANLRRSSATVHLCAMFEGTQQVKLDGGSECAHFRPRV